jgi:LysM repeat protein
VRIKIILIFILISFSSIAFSQGEEVEVKRSTEKIMLEGKVYFIHFVKEKETLNAISKAYNISEKIIALENPDVFAGLKAGMVLKIPADPIHAEEITIQSTDDFRYHVIKEGETLYFLSKKYGISVEEIEKYNPEVEYSDLQINQVIKIPKQQPEQPRDTFPSEDYFFHYVRKGETLYSLSVYYDVTIDEIKELNPELKWGELRFDEYIKIPRKQLVEEKDTIQVVTDSMKYDTLITRIDTTILHNWLGVSCDTLIPVTSFAPVKVGLFLPLFLHWQELLDSLTMRDQLEEAGNEAIEEEEGPKINPRIVGYLDFYEGILLALDSLKNAGISVTLYVYDTERDVNILDDILEREEVQNLDLIIGPVEEKNLELISDYVKEQGIPVVSPFTEISSLIGHNSYYFQMIPSIEIEFRNWVNYLADYWDDTMILVYNGDTLEAEKINFLKQELYEQLSMRTYFGDVNIKEVIINDTVTIEMEQFLTKEDRNIIIIPSTNEAYVSKILTSLFFLLQDYDIRVFGMSNWHKFQSIDLEYMHQMEVHYYTSFYVDYNKESIIRFIRKFRKVYGTEPFHVAPRGYNLSIYGFDLLFYFASGLNKYGKQFISCPVNPDYEPMLGSYDFKKRGLSGGFMNQYSIMIKFGKDLNITELKIKEPPGFIEHEDISSVMDQ